VAPALFILSPLSFSLLSSFLPLFLAGEKTSSSLPVPASESG